MFNIEQVNVLLESRLEELTEAQLEFLVENRLEFIKKTNKDAIPREHDPESIKLTTDKIVDHIASKIDPTSNKSNTQWLVNRYKAGDFKISDGKTVKKVLDSFVDSKKHLEHQDIGQYKSISHLKDALAPVQSKVETDRLKAVDSVKDNAAPVNTETERHGMPIIFNEDGHTGFKVPNRTRSIKNYGPSGKLAKTTWCTAANSNSNMFDGYAGGKYTLHTNDGNILQLHHQTSQLSDTNNTRIDLKRDQRFAKHAEVIKKFANVTHELEGKPKSDLVDPFPTDAEHINSLISGYDEHKAKIRANLAIPSTTYAQSQETTRILRAGASHLSLLKDAIKNSALTDEQFEKLSNFEAIDGGWHNAKEFGNHNLTENLAYSPHANPRQLEKIASTIDMGQPVFSGHNTLTKLIDNPNHDIQSHHALVDSILNSGNKETAMMYANSSQNALPEHIDRLLHHDPMHVSRNAILNPNFTPNESYFERLKDDDTAESNIVGHPRIPAHIAKHILDKTNDKVSLIRLAGNHSAPFEVANAAFMRSGGNVRKLIEHPGATKEAIDAIVKHHMNSDDVTKKTLDWLQSPRLSKDLVNHIVAHPTAHSLLTDHGISLVDSLNLKPSHLESLIASPAFNPTSEDHIGAILRSHALNSNVVDKLIQKTGATKALSEKLLSDSTNKDLISGNALHSVLDSDESSLQHKQKVIFHPSVQLSHFNKVKDDIRLHGAISISKNAPPSILHSLATSPMDHVRHNVANNSNTEKRTHDILKTDQNSDIAKISAKKASK